MKNHTRFIFTTWLVLLASSILTQTTQAAPTVEETMKILEERNHRFEQEFITQIYQQEELNNKTIDTEGVVVLLIKGHQFRKIAQANVEMIVQVINTVDGKAYKTTYSSVLDLINNNKTNFIKLLGFSYSSELGAGVFARNLEGYFKKLYESNRYYRMIESPNAPADLFSYFEENTLQIIQQLRSLKLTNSEISFNEQGQEEMKVLLAPKIEMKNAKAVRTFFSLLLSKIPDSEIAKNLIRYMQDLSDEEFVSEYETIMSELDKPLFMGFFVFENNKPVSLELKLSPYQLGFSNDHVFKYRIYYQATPKITLPDAKEVVMDDDIFSPLGDKELKIISLDSIEEDNHEMLSQKFFVEITQKCQTKACASNELKKIRSQFPLKHFHRLRKQVDGFYKNAFGLPLG